MRHKVTIQSPIVTKQSGVEVTSWQDFKTGVRASIETIKSFDKAALATTYPGADVTITMRYVAGLNGAMRIVYGDTIYSILGQPNDVDGRHREMILTCESGVKAQ